jgi:hypothetical protein
VNVVVPPEEEKYLPSSQAMQAVLASPAPYVPGIQRAQVPDEAAPDAVEYVPGPHALQLIWLDSSLYVPAAQSTQSNVVIAIFPGKQAAHVVFWVSVQSVLVTLPSGHTSQ